MSLLVRFYLLMASGAGDVAGEPLRIVAIGGGTGLSTLLHGLKLHKASARGKTPDLEITAIVTVTDDGGSSGRLRRDFDVLPPGDIRNCLVALSEDEAFLSRLFQYRFESGKGLKGHSFGNLFLTALTHLTGDFPKAVHLASEVLASCGRIYPATAANVALEASLTNGAIIVGESLISKSKLPIKLVRLRPASPKPMRETLQAIADADLITLGPGSLYTSIIPNLLVKGIPKAIADSRAMKAYFVNLMWQPGETINYSASDHVAALHQHARRRLLDCAIVNTRHIKRSLRKKYAAQQARPVENDFSGMEAMGIKVVARELATESDVVRHDAEKMAETAIELAAEARRRGSKRK